ncbi:uncharacterized protein MONOS_17866 [Monocercomonoides exilis]|uniref:uncharacterized protein n=1 Tax=Monocercomonoides exilis TaxID=2049356 RepID=UPI003559673D|nr:hypothetical protein MONOS_17866 [Monocercomonoides exilis]
MYAKEEDEAEADKPHSIETEMFHSSPSDDGSSDGEKKDEEQMQISKNDLAMFEESEIERSSIDIEKEEEEEEEEKVDGDMKFIFKKYKEQKQKEEIIHEVLEKWTRKL